MAFVGNQIRRRFDHAKLDRSRELGTVHFTALGLSLRFFTICFVTWLQNAQTHRRSDNAAVRPPGRNPCPRASQSTPLRSQIRGHCSGFPCLHGNRTLSADLYRQLTSVKRGWHGPRRLQQDVTSANDSHRADAKRLPHVSIGAGAARLAEEQGQREALEQAYSTDPRARRSRAVEVERWSQFRRKSLSQRKCCDRLARCRPPMRLSRSYNARFVSTAACAGA